MDPENVFHLFFILDKYPKFRPIYIFEYMIEMKNHSNEFLKMTVIPHNIV